MAPSIASGLVDDAIDASRARCPDPSAVVRGDDLARRLARARIATAPDAALRELGDGAHPALRWRRAELLDALGRPAEALAALGRDLVIDDARRRSLEVAAAAAAGQVERAASLVDAAPIETRGALATRLVAFAPRAALGRLVPRAGLDVAIALGDRLERDAGPVAALPARQRAVALAPDDADLHDAYARALVVAARIDDALAAWDRAAELAPAQPAFHLAPIRALLASGDVPRARARAKVLAARAGDDVEALVRASDAALAATDHAAAVTLMRAARQRKPTDGRLAFELGLRLLAAGDTAAGVEELAMLLACGAHGRPWHRHEVAGKLLGVASDPAGKQLVVAALDRPRTCAVAADDLVTYTGPLRASLAR